jgi:D-3-phosphoglycerate dehydrogenase
MKVLVCDKVDQGCLDAMRGAGLDVDVKTGMTPEQLVEVVPAYNIAIVRSATKFRKPAIDAAASMKLIVRGGVGLDNIDVGYAESKGIAVRNTPAAATISVAELALAMMFTMARKLAQSSASMKEGKWEKKAFEGTELYGKTLGIVGIGRIGSALAERATCLGMTVLAYDCRAVPDTDCYTCLTFDEIIRRGDFLSLHTPLTPETKNIINAECIAKMKDGVYIVNAARGGTIDEDALLDALKSGKVAGAALDVFAEEPTQKLELLQHPNVIASPHVGAQTAEGQARVGGEVASIVIDFAKANG